MKRYGVARANLNNLCHDAYVASRVPFSRVPSHLPRVSLAIAIRRKERDRKRERWEQNAHLAIKPLNLPGERDVALISEHAGNPSLTLEYCRRIHKRMIVGFYDTDSRSRGDERYYRHSLFAS